MKRRKGFVIFVLIGLVCCWSHAAQAQSQSSNYKFQITPYLFTTGVNGTIGEQGRTANVDASFSDVVHHLDMVAMVYFDGRIGRWRPNLDFLYTDVSDARATAGPLFSSVAVATKFWIVDPEVGYAILQKEGKELDLVGGVRIWNLDNSVTLFRPNVAFDRGSGTRSLADPVVGAAFTSDVRQKMFVFGKADIGRNTDWQAFGGGGYKFNDRIVGTVGYRYLSVDHSSSNSIFDVHLNGVILGLGFRF